VHISKKLIVFSILLMAILVAIPVLAQERFGTVAGVVKDPSGAVLPDVTVSLKHKDTNRTLTAKTTGSGYYTVGDAEPGRYSVTFEKTGFTRQSVPDFIVLVGKTTTVDASMKVGSVSETVEVSGAAPVIDTTSTMISHNVTAEELSRLPKGRTFEGVAIFSPSVNTGFVDGGYQINGASGAENNYYIDGVSVNSVIDGSARQTSTFDYLQEVQVKTTGLDAEYGGALGGVVSAITKSGGNAFHGDIHFFYSGNKLNAGPVKRLVLGNATGAAAAAGPYPVGYFQDSKQKSDNYEFGGALGGPIVKDKLWFYTAASPRWRRQMNFYQLTDGENSYTRGTHNMNWFSKVSWDPTSRIRTNFTFLYTPQSMRGGLPTYNNFGSNGTKTDLATADANKGLGYFQMENSVTGQVDFSITNSTLLSVKGGRYYLNYKDTGVDATRQWTYLTSSAGIPGVPSGFNQLEGWRSPAAAFTAHDQTTRNYIQADLSQSFRFGGQHNFKFGFGTAKNVNNVLDSWAGPNGGINVAWNSVCEECISKGGTGGGAFGYYSVDDGGTIGSAGSSITHLYFQDSWKVFPRLTVNAGVRLEKEVIPSFRPDIQKYAIQFGYGDKIAPRLGASFDLFGNGKVKISGGWGRYYDWTKYDLPRGTFGADRWFTYYRSLDDPSVVPTISLSNLPGTNLVPFDHVDWRLPGFEYLDAGVKPMSSETTNAGVEWEFMKGMVFSGRYVRSKLKRTIEDMGVLVNGSEQYFYGNPGEGQNTEAPSCYQLVAGHLVPTCAVPMPKATRTYDAMELSVSRRLSGGYLFNASYVYSRLRGNYGGLQSTDEILPTSYGFSYAGNQAYFGQNFRPGGNANRYFDLDQAFLDARGSGDLIGRLPTDRPHVFKFYGSKQFKFGTEVGAFYQLSSGIPKTTTVWTTQSVGFYPEGRADAGREPIFTQTDLMAAHEFKVGGESKKLRFEMNMINLFNQKRNIYSYRFYNNRLHRGSTGLNLTGVDLRQAFDWQALMETQAAGRGQIVDQDPRYGMASEFNPGFQARFLVKFIF